MPDKSTNSSEESRPTESSKAKTFPEPGDIADRSQQDDPNNHTPGNEADPKKNQPAQKTDHSIPQGALDEDVKRSIDEGEENVA
ncbi:MAG TPA: hypothetical protein VH088_20370 [Terriglobales bacterium]|jgi:hypothetical protein|nr:hypothetical protein [Terriglobales bacterium]